jgi:glucose dehydrogenase
LPLPGNANPISYSIETDRGDKQLVVIAAGGDARAGSGTVGDYLVAFGLPD